jgi:hypothetical protein
MKEELKTEITNLFKFIFEDNTYTKCIKYLNNNKFNDLRLLISEHYELLSVVAVLNPDNEPLQLQLAQCDLAEDLILDLYLEKV